MNAVLAKPIQRVWFIRTAALIWIKCMLQRFSLVCGRGCATIGRAPESASACCIAQ
jgi:hypothetical protein